MKLFDHVLTIFWQLLTTFLTTLVAIFWKLVDNFFYNFLQLFENFLTIFLIVTANCGNKYYGTNFVCAVPTSLLIAPGLRTIQFLLWCIWVSGSVLNDVLWWNIVKLWNWGFDPKALCLAFLARSAFFFFFFLFFFFFFFSFMFHLLLNK
jgi:hypothetical protein